MYAIRSYYDEDEARGPGESGGAGRPAHIEGSAQAGQAFNQGLRGGGVISGEGNELSKEVAQKLGGVRIAWIMAVLAVVALAGTRNNFV